MSFNGTPGVPTSWSETTIQVPVPAGATTGPVRVTAQAGGVSNGVEFSVRPAISLESFRGRWEWHPPVTITVSVPEGEEPATDTPVSFTFGGTAERGSDYEMAATVTLPAGARSVRTRLELIDDAHFEPRESIILQAAAAGYLASPEVEAFIYDDDATLTLTADPLSTDGRRSCRRGRSRPDLRERPAARATTVWW